jgi:hypothetical protein
MGCKREREREHPLATAAQACRGDSELSYPRPIFSIVERAALAAARRC